MRVLFVNAMLIGAPNATGDTLRRIFGGMSDMQILQYSLVPRIEESYDLDGVPVRTVSDRRSHPLNIFISRYHRRTQQGRIASGKKGSLRGRVKAGLKKFLLHVNEWIPRRIGGSVLRQIDDFSPQVIYTLAGDINVMRAALTLAQRYNVKIVVHNMDDLYHAKYDTDTPLTRLLRRKLQEGYRRLYRHSAASLAIGPMMAREYQEIFSIPFDYAMNCWDSIAVKPDAQPWLLIFSGGLHGDRDQSLAAIAAAIEELDVRLEIYTSARDKHQYEDAFCGFSHTRFCSFLPMDKVLDNLCRASVLIHVESYDTVYRKYYRLSMSTKIADYITVARPILCVGPDEIASVSFIRDQGIGCVFQPTDGLSDAIREYLSDQSLLREQQRREEELFDRIFERGAVQRRVRACLEKNAR